MKRFFASFIAAFSLALAIVSAPALALDISKAPRHYAAEMEYYYVKPRPEILAPMLKAFASAKILDRAEKRMFVAAFLSELARTSQLSLDKLLAETGADKKPRLMSAPDAEAISQTIAWAARLSGNDGALVNKLLATERPLTRQQILEAPSPLEAWNPAWEKSTLDMFWAAFMASGDTAWLDRIIETSFGHVHNRKGGSMAAASLYDLAPRHAAVTERARAALSGASSEEAHMLMTIIEHGEKEAKK